MPSRHRCTFPKAIAMTRRLQPLAALVATLWTTSSSVRRRIMAAWPCWCSCLRDSCPAHFTRKRCTYHLPLVARRCLSFVGADDVVRRGAELAAPRCTGCRAAAKALAEAQRHNFTALKHAVRTPALCPPAADRPRTALGPGRTHYEAGQLSAGGRAGGGGQPSYDYSGRTHLQLQLRRQSPAEKLHHTKATPLFRY